MKIFLVTFEKLQKHQSVFGVSSDSILDLDQVLDFFDKVVYKKS